MKKIVYFLLFALCLPIGIFAQSVDDDLYFVPSKDKQEKKETPVKKEPKKQVTTNIYTSPGTTVVVQDRKGRTRDVDEYNRRYDARENEFVMDNDTLYIKEKSNPDLDGEWVTGEFNGTTDDYEYAERIIRFRNPRFAISISSPLYWDVVYGPNSWDWNVYTDGMYAYAFPTFSNPLWWDWRYGSYVWGWNYGWGWNRPYYSWGYYPGYWGGGYWGGWYGGGYWGHHHHWHGGPSWGWGGGGRPYYAGRSVINGNNRSYYSGSRNYNSTSYRRGVGSSTTRPANSSVGQSVRRSGSTGTNSRVVGTRDYTRSSSNSSVRSGSSYSRRNTETYTRPSSTRTSGTSTRNSGSSYNRSNSSTRSSGTNSSRSSSSYSRGSSTSPSRSYTPDRSSSRSSNSGSYSRSSGSSYSSGSSGSYSRSSGSSGSSSRSSGGGGSSRSSGGSYRR